MYHADVTATPPKPSSHLEFNHMLAQIATALLAFASGPKLEDAKAGPTKTEYATPGTSSWKAVCDNACKHPDDGECDDGGLGSEYSACALGTDCNDCSGGVPLLPECVEPIWVDQPVGGTERASFGALYVLRGGGGWTRMDGGGQGPALSLIHI